MEGMVKRRTGGKLSLQLIQQQVIKYHQRILIGCLNTTYKIYCYTKNFSAKHKMDAAEKTEGVNKYW